MTVMTTEAAPAEPPQEPSPPMTCFVIGPIGNRHASPGSTDLRAYEDSLEVFEKVILPACERFGIQPIRADGIAHSGEITDQICRHVLWDDLVIADVGGGNANVMYELGLRHATGRPTIHIGEHNRLPFDISLIRTIQFTRERRSALIEARKELENAIEEGIRSGFVLLTPARILRDLDGTDAAAHGGPADPASEAEPRGLLDGILEFEGEMEGITADVETMGALIEAIGTSTDAAAADVTRANQQSLPMSARAALIATYARTIADPSKELRSTAERFAGRMASVDGTVRTLLDVIAAKPPGERETDDAEFLAQLIGLSEVSHTSMGELSTFGAAAESMGGMSRHLRGPAKDISAAVKRMTSAMERIDEWERIARSLQ